MSGDVAFQRFEVLPITGALGAEVRGIDLAATPDDATFEDLRRALDRYHVLAVRGQELPPPALHAVARRFGPFSGNPVHTPIDGYTDIVRFVREPDDTGRVIGEEWHMDLAWMEKPPGITLLFGEVIPPIGGDTCFASLEHTYRSLSSRMHDLLADLIGIHSGKGVLATNSAHKRLAIREDAARVDDIETEHPVICIHPVTGRSYVFISGVLTRFKGMTEEESKPIINFLIARAVRPENTCRVRWEQGTLTLWANPFVLHAAINDYASYRRVTYRSTVEGVAPRAAVASEASSAGRAA